MLFTGAHKNDLVRPPLDKGGLQGGFGPVDAAQTGVLRPAFLVSGPTAVANLPKNDKVALHGLMLKGEQIETRKTLESAGN